MAKIVYDEKKIDAIFTELNQCRLPGVAVGIAIGGKPVYRKGFGLANMELPVVLSPSIRMRIGSTTKHFTCLAYMLLCEEGKAGIDDPLGKYLPELHPVTHKVTMRQLMGNISGLRDACNIKFQFSGIGERSVSSTELLSFYRDIDDVNAAPGTVFRYSNGGFVLLSVVIELITGQPLEEVLRARIFEPLGMHDTMLRRLDSDFVPNSATPHMTNLTGGYERSYWGLDFAGGGAMVSTVDDMLRWVAHMNTPVVGSAATWTIMKTPQILANGTSTGYGLGLMMGRYRGVETLSHPGGWLGANAQMLKVPAVGLDIVVMVNRHDVSGALTVNTILDACLSELESAKEAPRRPFATGTFRSPATGCIIQLFAREGRQIASIDGYEMPMEFDGKDVLWPAGVLTFLKQGITLVGDLEQPTSICFSDFGNLDELVRVQSVDKPDTGAIVGRYRSDATGTEATIHETEDGLQLITIGRFGSLVYDDFEYLANNIWLVKPTGGAAQWFSTVLSFDSNGVTFRSSGNTVVPPFRRLVTS